VTSRSVRPFGDDSIDDGVTSDYASPVTRFGRGPHPLDSFHVRCFVRFRRFARLRGPASASHEPFVARLTRDHRARTPGGRTSAGNARAPLRLDWIVIVEGCLDCRSGILGGVPQVSFAPEILFSVKYWKIASSLPREDRPAATQPFPPARIVFPSVLRAFVEAARVRMLHAFSLFDRRLQQHRAHVLVVSRGIGAHTNGRDNRRTRYGCTPPSF